MKLFLLSALLGGVFALVLSWTKDRSGRRIAGILVVIAVGFLASRVFDAVQFQTLENVIVAIIGLLAGYCIYIAFEHVVPPQAEARKRQLTAHDWWLGAALISLFILALLIPHIDRMMSRLTAFSAGGVEVQFGDSVKTAETLLKEDTRQFQAEKAIWYAMTLPGAIESDVGFLRLRAAQGDPPSGLEDRPALLERTSKMISALSEPIQACLAAATKRKLDPELVRDALRRPVHALTRLALAPAKATAAAENARHAAVYRRWLEARNRLAELLGGGQGCGRIDDVEGHIWPADVPRLHALRESPYLYTFLGYLHVYIESVPKAIQLLEGRAKNFRRDINLQKLLYDLLYQQGAEFETYRPYISRALNIAESQCALTACGPQLAPADRAPAQPSSMPPERVAGLRRVAEKRMIHLQSFLPYAMAQAVAAGEHRAGQYRSEALEHVGRMIAWVEDSEWLRSQTVERRARYAASFYDTYAFVRMTFEMAEAEPDRRAVSRTRDALETASHKARLAEREANAGESTRNCQAPQTVSTWFSCELDRRQRRSIRSHFKRLRAFEARL